MLIGVAGEFNNNIFEVKKMVEKPSISESPSQLAIIGRYILDPEIFNVLSSQKRGSGNEIQLTDGIGSLIGSIPCYGYKFEEQRFDCGSKLGFLKANISFALKNDELRTIKEWLEKL